MALKTDRRMKKRLSLVLTGNLMLCCMPAAFSCNTNAWDNVSQTNGILSSQANANYEGNCGLRLNLDSTTQGYIEDLSPGTLNPAVTQYTARFYLYLGDADLGSQDSVGIFAAYDDLTSQLLGIELFMSNNELMARAYAVDDSAARIDHAGVPLKRGWRALEIQWQAANPAGANNGSLSLLVDGNTDSQPVSGLDNDTQAVAAASIGALNGNTATVQGKLDFDSFTSRRYGSTGIVAKSHSGSDPLVENTTFLENSLFDFTGNSITLGRRVTVDAGAVINISASVVHLQPGFVALQGAQISINP